MNLAMALGVPKQDAPPIEQTTIENMVFCHLPINLPVDHDCSNPKLVGGLEHEFYFPYILGKL